MNQSARWHKLTLEELLCVTPSTALVELTEKHEDKRNRLQLLISEGNSTLSEDKITAPPQACGQDDLDSYIILRWCPWFSRTFGVLSDGNLNMLTLRLLRINSEKRPILLELLAAVSLVLKQPDIPFLPLCQDASRAESFLFDS